VRVHEARGAAVLRALESGFLAAYPGQSPFGFAAIRRWEDGGPDPLDYVAVYWSDEGPHWHYVSHGLSETGEKTSPEPSVSGSGLELTFRLAAPPEARGDDGPWPGPAGRAPSWPVGVLNDLARYMHRTGRGFAAGHHIRFAPGTTRVETGVFVDDPTIPAVETPNGRVRFVQLVAVSADTYAARASEPRGPSPTMDALRAENPLGISRVP
jgi:hypothetical protein